MRRSPKIREFLKVGPFRRESTSRRWFPTFAQRAARQPPIPMRSALSDGRGGFRSQRLSNRGLARMNVRLFLLIGMTAFFAVLWSSDQQYQEVQMAAARTARQQLAELPAASVAEVIAPIDRPSSVPTSPF